MKCPICKTDLEQPDPNNLFCQKCKIWNPHHRHHSPNTEQEQIDAVVAQMVERQICDELTARQSIESVLNTFRVPESGLSEELSHLCEMARLKGKRKTNSL